MCMKFLSACMSMHHMLAWCPQWSEGGIRSGTGVRDDCELSIMWVLVMEPGSPGRADSVNCWVISPAPILAFQDRFIKVLRASFEPLDSSDPAAWVSLEAGLQTHAAVLATRLASATDALLMRSLVTIAALPMPRSTASHCLTSNTRSQALTPS